MQACERTGLYQRILDGIVSWQGHDHVHLRRAMCVCAPRRNSDRSNFRFSAFQLPYKVYFQLSFRPQTPNTASNLPASQLSNISTFPTFHTTSNFPSFPNFPTSNCPTLPACRYIYFRQCKNESLFTYGSHVRISSSRRGGI